jgi:Uma2 family endonuclease
VRELCHNTAIVALNVIEDDQGNKLPIYAAMRVPEIWRIVKKSVRIYLLTGDNYNESASSLAFPFLSQHVD